MRPPTASVQDRLHELHQRVDIQAAQLAAQHAGRLHCQRGCSGCCVDDLGVFEIEAERIRAEVGAALRGARAHAPGACVFLDDHGACRVYAARPYVCRTQGLPLRWLEPEAQVERRDICPLNEEGPALEGLPEDACFTLGPTEGQLAGLQAESQTPIADPAIASEAALRRVSLRDLFATLI